MRRRPTTNEFSIINRIFTESVNESLRGTHYLREDNQDGMGSQETSNDPYNRSGDAKAGRRQAKQDEGKANRKAAKEAENAREADDVKVVEAENEARRAGRGKGFDTAQGNQRRQQDKAEMDAAAQRRQQEVQDRVAAAKNKAVSATATSPAATPTGAPQPAVTASQTAAGQAGQAATSAPTNFVEITPEEQAKVDADNAAAKAANGDRSYDSVENIRGKGAAGGYGRTAPANQPFGLPSQNQRTPAGQTPASTPASAPAATGPKEIERTPGVNDKETIDRLNAQQSGAFGGPGNVQPAKSEEKPKMPYEERGGSGSFTEPAGGTPSQSVLDTVKSITSGQSGEAARQPIYPGSRPQIDAQLNSAPAQSAPAQSAPAQSAPAQSEPTGSGVKPFQNLGKMSPETERNLTPQTGVDKIGSGLYQVGQGAAQVAGDVVDTALSPFKWLGNKIGQAAGAVADYASETVTAGKEVVQQAAKGVGELVGVQGGQTDLDRQQAANAKPLQTDAQGIPTNLKMGRGTSATGSMNTNSGRELVNQQSVRESLAFNYANILREKITTKNPFLIEGSKHGKATQRERAAERARSMGFGVGMEKGPRGSVNVDAMEPAKLVPVLNSIINAGGEGGSIGGRPRLEPGVVGAHDPIGQREVDPRDALRPHIAVLYQAAEGSGIDLGMSDIYNPASRDHQALLSKFAPDHPVHAASMAIAQIVSGMDPIADARGIGGRTGVHRLAGRLGKNLS